MLNVRYSNGTGRTVEKYVALTEDMVTGALDFDTVGNYSVTITYLEKQTQAYHERKSSNHKTKRRKEQRRTRKHPKNKQQKQ